MLARKLFFLPSLDIIFGGRDRPAVGEVGVGQVT